MKNMTLDTIAQVCGGHYVGNEKEKMQEIDGVVIDSRLVEPGYLFIPIKGERVDGHQFIPNVFAKGALAVFSEYELTEPAGPYILVDSALAAMKTLAAYYRRSLNIKVIGITGSVGKTSTKEMVASVLSTKYNVLKTEGNLNNEIGLPLTIFKIREQHEVAVLEMGISEFGEMHRLAEMANPDICIITNIGLCHLENLHTRDGILKAKTESFEHLTPEGIAVLNGDDDKLGGEKIVNGRPAVFYGIGEKAKEVETEGQKRFLAKKEVYATDIEAAGLTKTRVCIHMQEGSFEVEIPIAGEHNVYNALAAVCTARRLGLSMEEMKCGIEAVETIGGRSNLIYEAGTTIIDDCYNANPVSMKASIDVLSKAEGRKIAVLGDMGELGEQERQLHFMVGEYFKEKAIDALFCTGMLSKEIVAAARMYSQDTLVYHFKTKEELIEKLLAYKNEGDTILVKASHFMGFTEIVTSLSVNE